MSCLKVSESADSACNAGAVARGLLSRTTEER